MEAQALADPNRNGLTAGETFHVEHPDADAPDYIEVDFMWIDPDDVVLLEEADGETNARYMRHETFARLTDNIKQDGALTSAPFLVPYHGEKKWLVLSGNHRTKAARAAKRAGRLLHPQHPGKMPVLFTTQELPREKRIGLQLSHNAIEGEDDLTELKRLYDGLNIEARLYAGLDDATLELLEKSQVSGIHAVNLDFQTITFLFFPDEVRRMKALWDDMRGQIGAFDVGFLARFADYDRFINTLSDIRSTHNVINVAPALFVMLDIVDRHRSELVPGYYDETTDTMKHRNHVPIDTVLDTVFVPGDLAVRLRKYIRKCVDEGAIDPETKYEALRLLLMQAEPDEETSDAGTANVEEAPVQPEGSTD